MGKRLTYTYVKKFIESDGSILLSDSYKNNRTKILIQCPDGHEYNMTFNDFQGRHRCPFCYNKRRRSDKKLTYKYVKNFIKDHGYILLSNDYTNSRTELLIKCSNGHEYNTTFNNFQQGIGCPVCWSKSYSSKDEIEVAQFVKSLGIDIVENDRTQIVNPLTQKNLELDIWIPALNKAIEYNGEYWHSFSQVIQKDTIKKQECKKLGIDLLVIHDDKWIENQQLEQLLIKSWLK